VAGLPRTLWADPDVRWLTGVHDAGDHTYFVCEPYEELLWWLQMPALLAIASETAPKRAELQALSEKVKAASAEADRVQYRLDALLGPEMPDHSGVEKETRPEDSLFAAQPKASPRERGENSSGPDAIEDSSAKENSSITPQK
jgi:hypothetical protein